MPLELDEHQERALNKAIHEASNWFIAWWAMGTGKTRLALAIFEASGFNFCIIVTRRVAFNTWLDEMLLCGLDYQVFQNDFSASNILRWTKNSKRILLVSAGDLENFPQKYPLGELLIVDELYLFANPSSKRSKALQRISIYCAARVGLSGTIMPAKDNTTIFGQLMALQAHRVLAYSKSDFQTKFQNRAKGRFGNVFTNKNGSVEDIKRILAPNIDLHYPEKRPTRTQIIHLKKTAFQRKAIESLQELYELNEKTYDFVLQIIHTCNGISNGWWMDKEEKLTFHDSEKITQLMALLEEITTEGEKAIIWCAYHNDIARIRMELKIPYCEFTAKSSFPSVEWARGDFQVVLATEANGSSVNDFKHVKYAIYYSIDTKLLNLQQSMTRTERKGSSHSGANYYFLQVRGTCDARTYDLVTKSDLAEKQLILELGKELQK